MSKKNSLGKSHGFDCQIQGTLFFEIARIIDYHRPQAFLLENVKNLFSHDKGRTFQTIIDVLENQLGSIQNNKCKILCSPESREDLYCGI